MINKLFNEKNYDSELLYFELNLDRNIYNLGYGSKDKNKRYNCYPVIDIMKYVFNIANTDLTKKEVFIDTNYDKEIWGFAPVLYIKKWIKRFKKKNEKEIIIKNKFEDLTNFSSSIVDPNAINWTEDYTLTFNGIMRFFYNDIGTKEEALYLNDILKDNF